MNITIAIIKYKKINNGLLKSTQNKKQRSMVNSSIKITQAGFMIRKCNSSTEHQGLDF